MADSSRLKQFAAKYWPTMIVVAVILYATLVREPIGADELPKIPHIDKLVHAIMMGGLVGAIAFDRQRAVPKVGGHRRWIITRRMMWLIFLGVAVFAQADELAQGFMGNGRSCDQVDYVADCVGALVAVFLAPPAIKKVLKCTASGD